VNSSDSQGLWAVNEPYGDGDSAIERLLCEEEIPVRFPKMSRIKTAENLAVLRRIAFTLLKQEKSTLSLENKRMKAAMSEDYLDQVLGLGAIKIS
jgi:hypothetical protein